MSILLHLDPETERQLRERAAAHGESLEVYLTNLIEQTISAEREAPSVQDWSAAWRSRAASHRALPTTADDSRASIYEGR